MENKTKYHTVRTSPKFKFQNRRKMQNRYGISDSQMTTDMFHLS